MVELRNLTKVSAVILTMITILTLTAVLDVGHVYGQTLVLTPNPVQQGVDVQITGNGFQQYENAQIEVYSSSGGACASIPLMSFSATTDTNGKLQAITMQTNGLSAGTYCVEGNGFLDPPDTVTLTVTASTGPTAAASTGLPIYIYALPLVIAFMVLAYMAVDGRSRKSDSY
ncbi:MAG TPA: hypothetical protein VEI80_00600 [Candidatus Acidoferrales bacterium]|nr:hypothetical protein [Candidatus Acidoferrales bacterium]